jgi:high affinity Mn2+ porin
VFVRQTFDLGGEAVRKDSSAMQVASATTSRRLVVTLGNFAVLDVFDHNSYAGDVRRQFLNMAFMTYTAFDMAADARGYTWGGSAELYEGDFAVRFGRFAAPSQPNQIPLDLDLARSYGDQLELEHHHELAGLPGIVRVLAFRNRENMGRFDDAIAAFEADRTKTAAACTTFTYGSMSTTAPDLCWVRHSNVKVGAGLSVEQGLGHGVGVFARAMINDGNSEVISYLSADSGVAGGVLATGDAWRRPRDLVGAGYSAAFISASHARYLGLGGIDGFVGDGAIHPTSERAFEAFYSYAVASWMSVTADVQQIWNAGFNADRATTTIVGGRLHVEI